MLKRMKDQYINGEITCLVDLTMNVIGGKWKAVILWYLGKEGVLRYGELKKILGKVTPKMMTQQLRELEALELVNRKEYFQIPPKVEYSLTEKGLSVIPLLKSMCDWSYKNIIKE